MGSGPGAASGNEAGFSNFRGALRRTWGKLAVGETHCQEIENGAGDGPRRDNVSERQEIADRHRKTGRHHQSGKDIPLRSRTGGRHHPFHTRPKRREGVAVTTPLKGESKGSQDRKSAV